MSMTSPETPTQTTRHGNMARIVAIAMFVPIAATSIWVCLMARDGVTVPIVGTPVDMTMVHGTQVEKSLVTNRALTPRDATTLSTMSEGLNRRYQALMSKWEGSGGKGPSPMPISEIATSLSQEGHWEPSYGGWGDLCLLVRCAQVAEDALKSATGEGFVATDATMGEAPDGDGTIPTCEVRCLGSDEGTDSYALAVSAEVALAGDEPVVSTGGISAAKAKRDYAMLRLSQLVDRFPELDHKTALEGYVWDMDLPDGTIGRTETWWLYVDADVAPKDIAEFVRFVDRMHDGLAETATDTVTDINVTVASFDKDDPAMPAGGFDVLAKQTAGGDDEGGTYMRFGYLLRGQATNNTPCHEEDLDGSLHPYTWGDDGA